MEIHAPPDGPAPDAPLVPGSHDSRARRALVWTKVLFASLDRARTFGLAAELAFWMFLSLIPLAAVAGLIVARFAMNDHDATSTILRAVPPSMRDLIATQLANVSAWNGGTVGPLAALTFVWLASSGVHSIFDALALETESYQRPWWKQRLFAIGTCVALSIGVAGLALLATGLGWIRRLAGERLSVGGEELHQGIALVLRLGAGAIVSFALVSGLYWVGLPKQVRRRMPLLPGAVSALVLMAFLAFGYRFYLSRMGTGDAYQAGLAVIAVTLMVLYLLSIALLAGAEINRVLGARRALRLTVHPLVAPPPAVTKGMIKCDGDDEVRPRHRRRRLPPWMRHSTA